LENEDIFKSTIQLVPPSLDVLAALIIYKKDIHYTVQQLIDKCNCGVSFAALKQIGYPEIQVASCSIGNGLTIAVTRTLKQNPSTKMCEYKALVWISKLACHTMCAFVGRICQGNLNDSQWLQIIEKKHLEMIDKLSCT